MEQAEKVAHGTFQPSSTSESRAGSRMMCAPELMDQEMTFFDLMGRVASYSLADDTLTLTVDDGATLVFVRG